jgi:hypothetical protein
MESKRQLRFLLQFQMHEHLRVAFAPQDAVASQSDITQGHGGLSLTPFPIFRHNNSTPTPSLKSGGGPVRSLAPVKDGAGSENRTRMACLEGRSQIAPEG